MALNHLDLCSHMGETDESYLSLLYGPTSSKAAYQAETFPS